MAFGTASEDKRPVPQGSGSYNGSEFPAVDWGESSTHVRRVTISLLTFTELDRCTRLISQLCYLLPTKIDSLGLSVTIVVRNNNPRLDIADFEQNLANIATSVPTIRFLFFNEEFNVGFGTGHNRNFTTTPKCDCFIILNDDILFPHIDWLDEAFAIFDNRPNVGAIGAINSPHSVTPFLGNGVFDRHRDRWPLRYAEASILLVRAKIFAEIGRFDEAYAWAYCEDSDLSFRIQAHGYDLEWLEIPHEHWRASSFNILPETMKSSIVEYNRSVLFSKWNTSLAKNKIGKYQIFDLWSEGLGDIFCAMLHLKTRDIDHDTLRAAISGCALMETFDWHRLTTQALELQRRFFMKILFHPVSERRFFDTKGVSIKTLSNLVDHIINETQDAVLSSL